MTTDNEHTAFAGLFTDTDSEPEFISDVRDYDADFARHVSALAENAGAEGVLSAQTKTLMTLALDAADGNAAGVEDLAHVARQQGVSEEAIVETVKVIANQGGLGKLAIASHALEG